VPSGASLSVGSLTAFGGPCCAADGDAMQRTAARPEPKSAKRAEPGTHGRCPVE
jgi:hypothetical protein